MLYQCQRQHLLLIANLGSSFISGGPCLLTFSLHVLFPQWVGPHVSGHAVGMLGCIMQYRCHACSKTQPDVISHVLPPSCTNPMCQMQLLGGSGSAAEFCVKGLKRSHRSVPFMCEVWAKHMVGVSSVNLDAWVVRFGWPTGMIMCFKSSFLSQNSFATPPIPCQHWFWWRTDKHLDPNEAIMSE